MKCESSRDLSVTRDPRPQPHRASRPRRRLRHLRQGLRLGHRLRRQGHRHQRHVHPDERLERGLRHPGRLHHPLRLGRRADQERSAAHLHQPELGVRPRAGSQRQLRLQRQPRQLPRHLQLHDQRRELRRRLRPRPRRPRQAGRRDGEPLRQRHRPVVGSLRRHRHRLPGLRGHDRQGHGHRHRLDHRRPRRLRDPHLHGQGLQRGGGVARQRPGHRDHHRLRPGPARRAAARALPHRLLAELRQPGHRAEARGGAQRLRPDRGRVRARPPPRRARSSSASTPGCRARSAATPTPSSRPTSQALHQRGKKVILSVGGENGRVQVADAAAATNFANTRVRADAELRLRRRRHRPGERPQRHLHGPGAAIAARQGGRRPDHHDGAADHRHAVDADGSTSSWR